MTNAKAKKILAWALKRLRVGDWNINFFYCEELPEWGQEFDQDTINGLSAMDKIHKTANVWVSTELSEEDTIETICHEAIEVAAYDAGINNKNDSNHAFITIMGQVLMDAYIYEEAKKGKKNKKA